ncbi:MAG: cytochrome c biogenesis protein CcsA [Chloroflexi bacterium]|nr:cytochrome c biogenesis protein CcsA [Chloroflexota bacterium]
MNLLATLGAAAVLTAFAAALFAVGASVYGLRAGHLRAQLAARRAIPAIAGLLTLAIALLGYALLTNDFSIAHVASVSSREMEPRFKWASLYSGQPGSLLFWTWTMSLFLAAFVRLSVPRLPWCAPHAVATAGAVLAAFLFALAFFASPFRVSAYLPADGVGLNPLLVDPGMLIHPPFLLSGLVSTSVPFTLGAAVLLAGRMDGTWLRHARAWALVSFLVLSVGNMLGGWWAYTVLGWGGYWGWDPVENSAILPLLPMIAFLHTLMVQERRGMLKLWNLVLVEASFALAVFGTFNVRSGLVSSVHSFAQSEIGPYFLVLVGLTVIASLVLITWRMPGLRADVELESLASRETGMLLNSYVMTAIALVVLGATLFPVFSELFDGSRITVSPPFYNDVVGPLLIALLALMALGVVLPWRGTARGTLLRRLRAPAIFVVAAMLALAALGMRDRFALAGTGAAIALGFVTTREYVLGTRGLRRATGRPWFAAFAALFARDQRRYGGYMVHLGIAVMAVAVIGSNIYQQQTRAAVAPGESFQVGAYTLTYNRLFAERPGRNGIEVEVKADVTVRRGDDVVATLEPGRRTFTNFPQQPVAIVAIDGSFTRDLYVFMQGWDESLTAEFQAFLNPLVRWLWLGGAIYVLGTRVALAPRRAPERAAVLAPDGALERV